MNIENSGDIENHICRFFNNTTWNCRGTSPWTWGFSDSLRLLLLRRSPSAWSHKINYYCQYKVYIHLKNILFSVGLKYATEWIIKIFFMTFWSFHSYVLYWSAEIKLTKTPYLPNEYSMGNLLDGKGLSIKAQELQLFWKQKSHLTLVPQATLQKVIQGAFSSIETQNFVLFCLVQVWFTPWGMILNYSKITNQPDPWVSILY